MTPNNNAMLIRRELLIRLSKLIVDDSIEAKIDGIPIEMRPRNNSSMRCCVHKDRAVLKYKIMAMLGFNINDETNELTTLKEYVQTSKSKQNESDVMLTVVDEACSACVKNNYIVTNMCHGCDGRPCMVNCPKDAIQICDGKAIIDNNKCVNCGLCEGNCPFHAIIYVPVPCEDSCPVQAINKNENGVEKIDHEKCINCGRCLEACPFGAILEKSHLLQVFQELNSGKKVKALIAPALIGQFKASFAQINESILQLGFNEVIEVARGAEITMKNEHAELVERLEEGHKFMTTSCCPAYTRLVNLHIPELKNFVSETKTPLQYIAEEVKQNEPEATTVFIGPCAAKRYESFHDKNVDYMLSFEEIAASLIASNIEVANCENGSINDTILNEARGFAASGGVTTAVKSIDSASDLIHEEIINGIDKKTVRNLKKLPNSKIDFNFLEVMACPEGCIGGCNVIAKPIVAKRQLNNLIKNN